MKRFSSIIEKSDLDRIFKNSVPKTPLTHSYHIDLLDSVNMLIAQDGFLVKGCWGASPKSDQINLPLIDFRQVHVKPTFRLSFRTQRCIILSDSYYVWRDSERRPVRVYLQGDIMFYPAVYFKTQNDQYGFTIISRPSRKSLREFCDHEPVIFDHDRAWKWLDFLPVAQVIKVLQTTLPIPLKTHLVSQKIFVKGFNSKVLHQTQQEGQVLLF